MAQVFLMASVWDDKLQVFGQPFPARTAGEALRIFSDSVQDDRSVINRHPEDYRLFSVGSFDDKSGTLVPVQPPSLLGTALEYVKKPGPLSVVKEV